MGQLLRPGKGSPLRSLEKHLMQQEMGLSFGQAALQSQVTALGPVQSHLTYLSPPTGQEQLPGASLNSGGMDTISKGS